MVRGRHRDPVAVPGQARDRSPAAGPPGVIPAHPAPPPSGAVNPMVSVASASVSSQANPAAPGRRGDAADIGSSARRTDSSVHMPSGRAVLRGQEDLPDRRRPHHRGDAAVHHEHLAVDARRGRAGQVHHQRRDVLAGRADPPRRAARPSGRPSWRCGRAGRWRWSRTPYRRTAARGGDGERGDPGLGRGVVGLAGEPSRNASEEVFTIRP